MSRAALLASFVLLVVVLVRPVNTSGQESEDKRTELDPHAMGRRLAEGLRATKGCLGVESARMDGGKNVIFAWFEDKAAVRRWYFHPTHKGFLAMMGGPGGDGEARPLEHVPDNTPLLVVASLTLADAPRIDGVRLPISSIAIELFTPASGGAYVNERWSPKAFPAPPHMRRYDSPPGGESRP